MGSEMTETERTGKENEGQEESELKVTDRRLFTSEGELRGEIDEAAEPDTENSAATPEREAEARDEAGEQPHEGPGFRHRPVEEPQGVDFTMLINAMAQPALIFLGEIAHPGTGKPEINLEQARLQIDLLDLLRVKCRGNLTREEDGLLDRMLYQLRMLFVSRSSQPGT
jgi:hypothetical protein